jgi:hypothetical protein
MPGWIRQQQQFLGDWYLFLKNPVVYEQLLSGEAPKVASNMAPAAISIMTPMAKRWL